MTTYISLVSGIIGIVIVCAVGWLAWKQGVLNVQKQTIDAYESRVTQQDGDIKKLQGDMKAMQGKYESACREISKLEGKIEGKEKAMADFAKAVAEAGVCAKAFDCPSRILPDP